MTSPTEEALREAQQILLNTIYLTHNNAITQYIIMTTTTRYSINTNNDNATTTTTNDNRDNVLIIS